jgi:hypothetical protein
MKIINQCYQATLDDFIESSKELEAELEAALNDVSISTNYQ